MTEFAMLFVAALGVFAMGVMMGILLEAQVFSHFEEPKYGPGDLTEPPDNVRFIHPPYDWDQEEG